MPNPQLFRRRNGAPSLRTSAALTAVPQATTLIVAIVVSPYIVSKIGLASFGLWSVVQAVLAFAQVASGGIPTIATRSVAGSARATDQGRATAREAFWLATTIMVLLTAAMLAIAAAVVLVISNMGNGGESLPDGWAAVAIGATTAFGLVLTSKASACIVQGNQRWDIDAAVQTVGQLAWGIFMVAALEAGLGLPGLAVGAAAPGVVGIVAYTYAGHRLVGGIGRPVRPGTEVRAAFRSQTLNLQVVAFVGAVNAQADRFLLLPFAPLSWIGAYALGSRMATALRAFPVATLLPLIARGSHVFATEALDGIRRLYTSTLRTFVGLIIALLVAAYAALYPAVLAWLGSEFTISATAALVLGLSYAFNLVTGPGTALAMASGRSDLDRDYNVLGLVINLALTIPLGVAFGPWGVVAATSAGLVLSSVWLVRSIDAWLGISSVGLLTKSPSRMTRVGIGLAVGAATVVVTDLVASDERLVNLAVAFAGVSVAAVLLVGREATSWVRARRSTSAGATT